MGIINGKGTRENGNGHKTKMASNTPPGAGAPDEPLSEHIHVYHRPRILVELSGEYPSDLVKHLRGKGERTVVLPSDSSEQDSSEQLVKLLTKGIGRTDLLITDNPSVHEQVLRDLEGNFPYAGVIIIGSQTIPGGLDKLLVESVDPSELQNPRTFVQLVERILVKTDDARRTYRAGEELIRDLHAAHDLTSRIDKALEVVTFPKRMDVVEGLTFIDPSAVLTLLQTAIPEHQFALAHRLFRRLYHAQPPQGRGHTVFYFNRFSEGVTEGGALGIGFADEPFVLKRVSRLRAATVVRDSRYFESRYPAEFSIEHVSVATVSKTDANAYLWKEFIPGPTLSEVLGYISGFDKPTRILRSFRNACLDVAVERIDFWERHALPVDETKDPTTIAESYNRNLINSFDATARRLHVSFTPAESAVFEEGVTALGYAALVTEDTIVRKAESALVNMILRLPSHALAREPLEKQVRQLISLYRRPRTKKFDREKLKHGTVQVDASDRYSHALENLLEVLESPESGFSARDITTYLEKKLDAAEESIQPALRESVEAIGFYRVMRKLYFVCDIFGPDAYIEAQRTGRERSRDFTRLEGRYHRWISHYVDRAAYWLVKRANVEEEKNAVVAQSVSPEANSWYQERSARLSDIPSAETYREYLLPVLSPSSFSGNETKYAELRTGVERILLFRMMVDMMKRFGQNDVHIDYLLQE